jgi:broad specificity phosphatase PhoE
MTADGETTTMRYVELRRHTMRTRPGQHLSQAGVSLARRVGEGVGPFDRVVTSTLPRAFETAIAMGFAVDEQIALLAGMGADVTARACAWRLTASSLRPSRFFETGMFRETAAR